MAFHNFTIITPIPHCPVSHGFPSLQIHTRPISFNPAARFRSTGNTNLLSECERMDLDDLFTPNTPQHRYDDMDSLDGGSERQLDCKCILGGNDPNRTGLFANRSAVRTTVVFVLDCTGSMGSYIASATKNIELIVENITQSERLSSPTALQIGLISYRQVVDLLHSALHR